MTTIPMLDELQQLETTYSEKMRSATTAAELELIFNEALHRKHGKLTAILKQVASITDIAERKVVGTAANQVKGNLTTLYEHQLATLGGGVNNSTTIQLDPTLPGISQPAGHLHPMRQVQTELVELFSGLGFSVYEGNELENELFCFEYLNIPESHPARDLQDTFYIKDLVDQENQSKLVLRTHTSNMQVRIMQELTPPLRVIVPGRVFRNEATDATHDHTFYQIEGMVVDTDISIANLTQILATVLSSLLSQEVKIRLRPGYFPYVEPGFEVDCYTEATGWMEMLGCGMIHPKVFESVGYEAGRYTGFAFGLGINRLAMLKYGINDGRGFMSGDMRFLNQF